MIRTRFLRVLPPVALVTLGLAGCGPKGPPAWPDSAKKWFERAEYSYKVGDLDDAVSASDQALLALPNEAKIRLTAGRIALARLEFSRALELVGQMPGAEASAIRGRAHWYLGNLESAADELEAVQADPDVRDPWASQVAKLARLGRGRRPFETSGGLLAVSEMPRTGSTAMIVPVELNGEPTLAMIATDLSEAVIDLRDAENGAWVSVRFGGRVEVSDVPAMGRDLSGLAKQIGVPVKLLIGVNLLRHMRATIDFSGSQFVVRTFDPPAPPDATTVHPIFYKGGAMVLPGALGADLSAPRTSLFMNTSVVYPLALDDAGWKKAGQDPATFVRIPGSPGLKQGAVPLLRLGAFELPNVPGVAGTPFTELEETLGVDLDGAVGSGLFATFRVTFADQGRNLWLEDLPPEVIEMRMRAMESLRRRSAEAAGVLPPAGGAFPGGAGPGSSFGPGPTEGGAP